MGSDIRNVIWETYDSKIQSLFNISFAFYLTLELNGTYIEFPNNSIIKKKKKI